MVLTRGSRLKNNRKPSLRLVYEGSSIGFRLVFDWFSIGKPSLGQRRRCRGYRGGGKGGRGVSVWVGEMAAPALFTSYFLSLTTSYAPALPSSWLGMMWLPRKWVETILHQFKDIGIVGFLVRTLRSTNQRMYSYLLFLQMAPLCSGCCGRTCEN